jgi:hypothetical protein
MNVYIPQELREYEDDLHFFFDLMIRKLHLNRHKGFVDDKTIQLFFSRLQDEMAELKSAIDSEAQFDVALECTDLSNIAFLLALCCLHQTKDQFNKERTKQ